MSYHSKRQRLPLMKFLSLVLVFITLLSTDLLAQEIPVILSNDIEPYRQALMGFQKNCIRPIRVHDIKGKPEAARKLAGVLSQDKHPVVVAVGTPALEAAIKYFPNLPILFSMVHSPPKQIVTHAGLTGVFLDIPLEKYLVLIKKSLPQIRRVGILMNPIYLLEHIEDMKVASKLLDLTIHIKKAGTLTEALYAIEDLAKKNEVLLIQPDPVFATPTVFEYALKQSLSHAVPLIGISEDQVKHGALMGLAVDYQDLGKQAALMCNQILTGTRLPQLPIVGPSRYRPLFNLKTANLLHIHIPSSILEEKENIF